MYTLYNSGNPPIGNSPGAHSCKRVQGRHCRICRPENLELVPPSLPADHKLISPVELTSHIPHRGFFQPRIARLVCGARFGSYSRLPPSPLLRTGVFCWARQIDTQEFATVPSALMPLSRANIKHNSLAIGGDTGRPP